MCDFPRARPPGLQLQQLRQLTLYILKTKAYLFSAVAAVWPQLLQLEVI
jgi:hypothetical protein